MKAPEQIWAEPGMPGYLDEPHELYTVQYTRTDVAQAMVAAGYEAAAQLADSRRDACGLDQDGNPYVSEEAHIFGGNVADNIACNIRALTPTDAKAALDRIVQEAVRDALENARGAVLAERLFDEISTSDHRAHNAALDSAVQAIADLKGGEA